MFFRLKIYLHIVSIFIIWFMSVLIESILISSLIFTTTLFFFLVFFKNYNIDCYSKLNITIYYNQQQDIVSYILYIIISFFLIFILNQNSKSELFFGIGLYLFFISFMINQTIDLIEDFSFISLKLKKKSLKTNSKSELNLLLKRYNEELNKTDSEIKFKLEKTIINDIEKLRFILLKLISYNLNKNLDDLDIIKKEINLIEKEMILEGEKNVK